MTAPIQTWTLADIRTWVRKITGKLSVNQMSDIEINGFINDFYTRRLPKKLLSPLFEGWWQETTVPGIDEITVDLKYLSLRSPFFISGRQHILKEDATRFYHRWQPSYNYGPAKPYDALYFNGIITLRPVPDDAYIIKSASLVAPDPMATDADSPLDNSWGLAIAYGAGIVILLKGGDYQGASAANEVYNSFIDQETVPALMNLSNQRSIPRI